MAPAAALITLLLRSRVMVLRHLQKIKIILFRTVIKEIKTFIVLI